MNEAERLPDALASVSFCDEIIVVDGGSTDGTQKIATSLGARVVENPWPGYSKQRNVAADLASSEWILEIDADERVSPELRSEIEEFLEAPPAHLDMAILPLRDTFIGRVLGPSAKYPRYRNRLFRRSRYRHDERRLVHEGLFPHGEVWPMANDLVHLLADDWGEAFSDCVRYASLEAQHRDRPGIGELIKGTILRPAVKFAYRSFALGGWRDGVRGIGWITAECTTDALTTALAIRSRPGATVVPQSGERDRTGSVRIVGIAGSRRGAIEGAAWLAEAERAGADVTLIAAHEPATDVRVQRLPHFGPLETLRALETEAQIRPVDGLVVHDSTAWWLGIVPPQRGFPRRIRVSSTTPDAQQIVQDLARMARSTRSDAAVSR